MSEQSPRFPNFQLSEGFSRTEISRHLKSRNVMDVLFYSRHRIIPAAHKHSTDKTYRCSKKNIYNNAANSTKTKFLLFLH